MCDPCPLRDASRRGYKKAIQDIILWKRKCRDGFNGINRGIKRIRKIRKAHDIILWYPRKV